MAYRKFRSLVVVPLIAAPILLGFGSHTSHAGQTASDAFDMGWCLGVASYQASVNQVGLANTAIGTCTAPVTRLIETGVLGRTSIFANVQSFPDLHAGLVSWRERYEIEIRRKSNNAANAYRLGLLAGLAEGQCTSPVWGGADGAWRYANDALKQAQTLIATSSLSRLRFDRQLMNDALYYTGSFFRARADAYRRVVALKGSYRNVVLVSNY